MIYILITKLGDVLTELRKPAADLVDVPLPPDRHDGRLRTACKSERVAVDAAGAAASISFFIRPASA